MSPTLPRIFVLLAAMLLLWEAFLRVSGWQAPFAESNLQANLTRISSFAFHPVPPNLILGSSLSGRLLPEFFAENGGQVGNLALDGAGVPLGLDWVRARPQKPARLFLEANTLFFRSPGNEEILRQSMANPVFGLGRFFYFFRPGSRPSAWAYSWLKQIREEKEEGVPGKALGLGGRIPPPPQPHELEGLRQLRRSGIEIDLVVLPTGQGEENYPAGWQDWTTELGIRWILPRQLLPDQGMELRYTDGLHLDRPSAKAVCRVMQKAAFGP